MVDLCGFHVGKYSSPMDPMSIINSCVPTTRMMYCTRKLSPGLETEINSDQTAFLVKVHTDLERVFTEGYPP